MCCTSQNVIRMYDHCRNHEDVNMVSATVGIIVVLLYGLNA